MNNSTKTTEWFSRFKFYFAAMGLGFGLGNLWRFPYVVYENGGGAFVLLYLLLTLVVGVPILCGELILGKIQKKPIVSSLDSLSSLGSKMWKPDNEESRWEKTIIMFIAWGSVVVCFLVLSYFAVISGWVLYYVGQFASSLFVGDFEKLTVLSLLRQNGMLQMFLAALHMIIVTLILFRGRYQQKETWVGYLMPLFGVLVVLLAFKSLSLEKTPEAMKYLFYPDFSRLTIASPGAALGHLLFTLSLGLGAMITFGKHLQKQTYVPRASLQVAAIDSIVSLGAGLLIFPMVMSTLTHFSGPELLFQTAPVLFQQIPNGAFWGLVFFFCLYAAAVGSSIGLLETVVDNIQPKLNISMRKTLFFAVFISLLVANIPAFSSNFFSHVLSDRGGLLRLWDKFLINWLLPVLALVVSQVVRYKVDKSIVAEDFRENQSPLNKTLYNNWRFLIKWIIPLVVITCLSLQVLNLFL